MTVELENNYLKQVSILEKLSENISSKKNKKIIIKHLKIIYNLFSDFKWNKESLNIEINKYINNTGKKEREAFDNILNISNRTYKLQKQRDMNHFVNKKLQEYNKNEIKHIELGNKHAK